MRTAIFPSLSMTHAIVGVVAVAVAVVSSFEPTNQFEIRTQRNNRSIHLKQKNSIKGWIGV